MVNSNDLDILFSQIMTRYQELKIKGNSARQESFLMHLQSLAHWEQDAMDYPDVTPDFPEVVQVAYAVCHPNCGTEELIVDGSTQECQHCGQLMFRTDVHEYVRK